LIIDKYKRLEEQFDFVLVEGTSFSGEGTVIELDMNVLIAKKSRDTNNNCGFGVGKHWRS
jgi:phosphate acetyltransferase